MSNVYIYEIFSGEIKQQDTIENGDYSVCKVRTTIAESFPPYPRTGRYISRLSFCLTS